MLSMSTEESLGWSGFNVEQFVPALVGLLHLEHNGEMMLLAARALTHLLDVLPSSGSVAARHGAAPALCAKLLAIEYMDLAEQALEALEKLSATRHGPAAIVRSGGLTAVLSFLDFFPTSVQRIAVRTAANSCFRVPADAFRLVLEALHSA